VLCLLVQGAADLRHPASCTAGTGPYGQDSPSLQAIHCCQEAGRLQAPYSNAHQAGSRIRAPSNCGCQPLRAVFADTATHSQSPEQSDCTCLQLPFALGAGFREQPSARWIADNLGVRTQRGKTRGAVPSGAARCQGGCAAHRLCIVRLGRVHADPFTKRGRALLTPPRRQGAHAALAGSYRKVCGYSGSPAALQRPFRSLAQARAACNFTAAGAGAPPCSP